MGRLNSGVRRAMKDHQWRKLLKISRQILGKGSYVAGASESWCAFTTFSSLTDICNYWHCGLPDDDELEETGIADGGIWGQPFLYADLAHIIFPATFRWERFDNGQLVHGERHQPIHALAAELEGSGIPFRLTELVLEVKLY
jgi:hypothetical protein